VTSPHRPGDGRLFWPGDTRAGALMSDWALLTAMESVEHAWLEALAEHKIAPAEAQTEIRGLLSEDDLVALADHAEASGNPVIGLVQLLRERLSSEAARWVHRGLTSQDVLDTALMICLRDIVDRLDDELRGQVEGLRGLVSEHRSTPMVGRTLTQHAVPITFGLKAAGWLAGVLDAADALAAIRSRLPVQLGGAAGSLAASTELARLRGLPEPAHLSWRLVESVASALGLAPAVPWHTSRSVITAAGDALVGCTDAYGRIAADVATLSRPEIAEVAEGSGGGSSTMAQKHNPVLSVLIRRAALTGPPLASTLHVAAATNVDERPDGSWHAEWATLRDLARRTAVAASQASELITGLVVDEDRMAANLAAAAGIEAEQQAMADLVGAEPTKEYLGATELIIDRVLARAGQRPGVV
jgi:3-carboxy-cis,cis-muconate cycloisomerase